MNGFSGLQGDRREEFNWDKKDVRRWRFRAHACRSDKSHRFSEAADRGRSGKRLGWVSGGRLP
jgi:hypothetical protein